MPDTPSPLFPELAPFTTYMLPVDNGHSLYIERSGNPAGLPVIVLHGGPGSGTSDKARRRFDPAIYHIIAFDQRGAGKSTPAGSLTANTTAHLIRDIETIRTDLGIEQWVVYGTSWGCTLALAYAQTEPQAVMGLIVGGVFLSAKDEYDWFNLPGGLPRFRWKEYQAVLEVIPEAALAHIPLDLAFLQIITGPNVTLARRAAEAFAVYESSACFPEYDLAAIYEYTAADEFLIGHIAIELHYFTNHCFLTPHQLLDGCPRIAHIPTLILQGGLDLVCPPATAHQLHAALPQSELTIVASSGHVANDQMEAARIAATNAMAAKLGF